jgi:HNH endonuclease
MIKKQSWCSYCRVEVSDDLPPNHPRKATIDHLQPLTRGGRREEVNECVACWRCNNVKRARVPSGPDPNRSRDW